MFSGSSSSEARLLLGFQAFSALFSLTSSLRDTVAMIFRGSFLWLCWERRGPKPEGWHGEKKNKTKQKTHKKIISLLQPLGTGMGAATVRLLRPSAPSRTSVAQTQQLDGWIITDRHRGRKEERGGHSPGPGCP